MFITGKAKGEIINPTSFTEMRKTLKEEATDVIDLLMLSMDRALQNPYELAYLMDAKEYVGFFKDKNGNNMTEKEIYNHLKEGTKDLYELTFNLSENKKKISYRIIVGVIEDSEKNQLKLHLSPYFLRIAEKQKEKYAENLHELKYQFSLLKETSKKLYPMVLRMKKSGIREDELKALKYKLNIPEITLQKETMTIINEAITEINEKTALHVSIETKDTANKEIEKIIFKISPRKNFVDKTIKEEPKEEPIKTMKFLDTDTNTNVNTDTKKKTTNKSKTKTKKTKEEKKND